MRSALAFLTTLPVGRSPVDVRQATLAAFPGVGLLLGLAWWLVAMAGTWAWDPLLAAALVVFVDLLLTGGLHVDAMADMADGVASRRQGEALRSVLADPRVGAVGAAALGSVLLVRVAAITLVVAGGGAGLLVVVPLVGRVGMVMALAVLPRTTGSLTASFVEVARGAVLVANVAALALTTAAVGLLTGRPVPAGVAAGAATLLAAGLAAGWRRRHGFASGDVVGACGHLAETLGLLVLAAV